MEDELKNNQEATQPISSPEVVMKRPEDLRLQPISSPEVVMKRPEDLRLFLDSLEQTYEEVSLPSKGLFYQGKLPGGVVHVRAMTLKEEKFLATQRLVRSGKAIDMIFESCMQEDFPAEDLLSIDRTFLLIWLRGISYGNEYDVQIKCPSCSGQFPETIDLSDLPVDFAKEDLQEPQSGVFPRIGKPFRYRLMRGKDEASIARYRDRRAKNYGDEVTDDTMIRRDSLLLEDIDGFTGKNEIQAILEKLPMEDGTYLRNLLREPGFGVNTDIPCICPYCQESFDVDLPLDANFFFPKGTKKQS